MAYTQLSWDCLISLFLSFRRLVVLVYGYIVVVFGVVPESKGSS